MAELMSPAGGNTPTTSPSAPQPDNVPPDQQAEEQQQKQEVGNSTEAPQGGEGVPDTTDTSESAVPKDVDLPNKKAPNLPEMVKNDPQLFKAIQAYQRFAGMSPDKAVEEMRKPQYKIDPSYVDKIVNVFGGQDNINAISRQRKLQEQAEEARQKGEIKREEEKGIRADKLAEDEERMKPAAQALLDGNFTSIKDLLPSRALNRIDFFNVIQKLAKEQGKEYNAKDVDAKFNVLKLFSQGKAGDQIQSFNTFLGHVGEAWDANQDWVRANSPLANKPMSWLAKNATNDPTYTQFLTAIEPVKQEYMTFLQNNHALTEQDKAASKILLDDNATPLAITTALKTMAGAAGVRLNTLNERWKRTMNTDFPDLIDENAAHTAEVIDSPILSQMLKGKLSGGSLSGSANGGGIGGKRIGEEPPKNSPPLVVPKGMLVGKDAQGNIVGYKDPSSGQVTMFKK